MRSYKSLLLLLFVSLPSFATIPPMKGGPLPEVVRIHAEKMQSEYPKGNLARIMQKWTADKEMVKIHPEAVSNFSEVVTARFPVLVGKYSDAVNVQADAPEQLQSELFDGPWAGITMRQFYLENSYNQFELSGTIYGWIQAASPESVYTGPQGTYGHDGYAANFVRELIDSVDADVNFADFDNDGDGFVETVIVVHSGPGQEYYGSNPTQNHIWSHSSSLGYYGDYYYTNDVNSNSLPVKINRYIIQPAINSNGTLISIGVFCHEFGHALGLPDLYDTSYNSEGIGEWGLMGGGSWNTPASPSHFTAWSKEILGWMTTVTVDEDISLQNIQPVENEPVAYKLWYEGAVSPYTSDYGARLNVGRQYFLVENRQRIGSDQYLHAPGILIWHIDNSVTTGNTVVSHKLVDLEEADGLNHLDNNVNSGDAGDPFPGSSLNQMFDYYSNPDSRAYNGNDSKVTISNFIYDMNSWYADLAVGMIRYEYLSYNFDDSYGNANGILEPGEEVHLVVELRNNTGSSADNMTLELTSASGAVTISNPQINLGNIASGDSVNNTGTPFIINISPTAGPTTCKLNLRLMVGTDYDKIRNVDLVIGIPTFLVIDEDQTKFGVNYFRDWLEVNNYAFELISPAENIDRKLNFTNREILVVIGGDNPDALADTTLQDSLAGWIDTNKKLLVVAPAASSYLGATAFAQNTLGIQYVNSTTNIILRGTAGDPLGFNGSFAFLESGTYQMVNPDTGSIASLKFNGTTSGGIVYHQDANNNRIVYSSIDFRYVRSNSPLSGEQILSTIMTWFDAPTGIVNQPGAGLLSEYRLMQNYPNPFNPSTTIRFYIPQSGEDVRLDIFNALGQRIKSFDPAKFNMGWNSIEWDGTNQAGTNVASGIYYLVLKSSNFRQLRKMILLK